MRLRPTLVASSHNCLLRSSPRLLRYSQRSLTVMILVPDAVDRNRMVEVTVQERAGTMTAVGQPCVILQVASGNSITNTLLRFHNVLPLVITLQGSWPWISGLRTVSIETGLLLSESTQLCDIQPPTSGYHRLAAGKTDGLEAWLWDNAAESLRFGLFFA